MEEPGLMEDPTRSDRTLRLFPRLIARAARLLARGIYRSVEVYNAEPGWSHFPSIIVANHPTGFSDPALLFGLLERNPRFLAKATLWNTPGLGWFLDGVGAIPVYRAQDGSTTRNAEMFAAAFVALAEGDSIAMFPEGKAHDPPHLAPIKTGAARLAFGAVDAGVTGLRVVPIGIHYEDKAAVRSRAYVHVGDVLEIDTELSDVLGGLAPSAENHVAVNLLTQEIRSRLAASAPDYTTDAEARMLGFAADVTLRDGRHPEVAYSDREKLAAEMRQAPDAARNHVISAAREYYEALDAAGVHDIDIVRPTSLPPPLRWGRLLLLVLLLPFALAGVLLNVLPYLGLLSAMRYRHQAMTPSTIRMVAAVLAFFVTWIVWAVVAWSLWNWRMALIALIAAPLYGAIALWVLDNITSWRRARRGRKRVAALDAPTTAALAQARLGVTTAAQEAVSR